jgi:HSP20 family molecular chaperone IbpA
MPEVTISQRNQQQQQDELADLATEYARKRKKLVSEKEGELDNVRQNYHARKESVQEQGEAAINHIKKAQSEDFERSQEARHKIQQKAQTQLGELENGFDQKIQNVKESRSEIINRVRNDTQKKVQDTEAFNNKKIQEVKERTSGELRYAQDRYNKQIQQLQENTKERIADLNKQSEDEIKREIEQGNQQKDEVRHNNQENLAKIQKTGEETLFAEKKGQENRHMRLDKEYQKRFDRQQRQWMSREASLNHDFSAKLENTKEAYDDQLKTQDAHFKSKYSKNDSAERTALGIQENNYNKQLNLEKQKFLREATKYDGKEQDPFYKVQDRGSRMSETPYSYVIEAYVPEHEKDAVKVTVEKGRATVQGQRAFKDKFDTDEKKVSTATYQSFREEFPFDKPVATEGMTRERDGDYMVITVPKIQNISRKA